jgi:S1-C subfamily serine protease
MLKVDSIVKIIASNVVIDPYSPYKVANDSESIGTGFFINEKGYILTCAHVVEDSIKIWINVPTKGKDKIEVILHSICYDKDLAILKTVDYKNVSYCEFGNSDACAAGDTVTAIGYPLGQTRLKITKGIISGRQEQYIQTDTPINPGNSGGPLLDKNKKVIGINTSKITSTEADNIGYAMPIYDFIIIQDIMLKAEKKIIKEPYLYCHFQTTDKNHYNLFGCTENHGILIKNLIKNSPMYNAGIRENDILLNFDNHNIDGYGDIDVSWSNDKISISDFMSRYTQESIIPITFWNSQEQKKKQVSVIFNNGDMYKIKHIRYPFEKYDYEIFCGMVIMELNANHLDVLINANISNNNKFKLKKYSVLKHKIKPILFISNILQGTYISAMDDIMAGDIITNVNGQDINTLQEFRKYIVEKSLKINKQVHVYLKLDSDVQVVINVNDIIKNEKSLSEQYKYNISGLYKKMNILII